MCDRSENKPEFIHHDSHTGLEWLLRQARYLGIMVKEEEVYALIEHTKVFRKCAFYLCTPRKLLVFVDSGHEVYLSMVIPVNYDMLVRGESCHYMDVLQDYTENMDFFNNTGGEKLEKLVVELLAEVATGRR